MLNSTTTSLMTVLGFWILGVLRGTVRDTFSMTGVRLSQMENPFQFY